MPRVSHIGTFASSEKLQIPSDTLQKWVEIYILNVEILPRLRITVLIGVFKVQLKDYRGIIVS